MEALTGIEHLHRTKQWLLRTPLDKAGVYRCAVHPESPDTNPLPTCLSLSTEVLSSTPPRGLPLSHGDNALVGELRLCEQTGLLSPLAWVARSLLRAVSPRILLMPFKLHS